MTQRLLIPLFLTLLLFGALPPSGHAIVKSPDPFKSVRARLVKDGFPQEKVDLYFQEGARLFAVKGVSGYFMHNESKLNYGRFLKESALDTGRRYLKGHQAVLDATEAAYGVDKEIITAVLMVETALGSYIGSSRVFEILATLASLSNDDAKARLWKAVPANRRITRKRFEKKTKDKSEWAYRELKALLRYGDQVGKDPRTFIGSYAGAMGISQFMPSRILQLGVDGDKDGQVDLYTHEDAIASVANYLRHFGWKPGIEKEKALRVLMRYNHSIYYARTLHDIMDALKRQS
ncbi:lytic murein transglycosylase [Desulfoluna sp.]|uniref:lytic murein transglycosylase n=1 Tax=Desulfoluna sp. TaxID=2045199 RepID=UPI00262BDA05|nr:lytic murein transglycosylase [Desulfoluna sp.]